MNENYSPRISNDSRDKELRWKYYRTIREKGEFSNTFMEPPAHWLNPAVFSINPEFDEDSGKAKKNKSWVTILSVWNTMIGTGIVSMPYCVSKAGIIPTIFLNIIYGLICYYTCQVIIKTGKNDNDYSDTVDRIFGTRWGWVGRVTQIIFGLFMNVGALFIFYLIINQNLFPIIALLLNKMGANLQPMDTYPYLDRFSIFYCGIFVGIVIFPLLITKHIAFLIKLNSYGVYFVLVSIIFVISNGIYSICTTTFDFEYILNHNKPNESPRHLYLFGDNPILLAGTLTLSYFSHSFALPMMKNNERQENNKRDLFLGYCLVFCTYVFLGILGYIGFSGEAYDANFKNNWFQFFEPNNVFILILRLFSVFQLSSIFPVVTYIVRIQFFGTFYKNDYPSRMHVIVFSGSILVFGLIVVYFCYDMLGKLMGIIGAGAGLFLIYIIPLVVNIKYYEIKHPHISKRKILTVNGSEIETTNKTEEFSEVLNSNIELSKKPPSHLKDLFFYISQYFLMIFGAITLVLQFIPWNVFDIHFKE